MGVFHISSTEDLIWILLFTLDGGAAVSEFMVELLNERKEFRKQQKTDSLLKKGEKRQDEVRRIFF